MIIPAKYQAWLYRFVRESNAIENIHDDPSDAEMAAHLRIMDLQAITISDLEAFVSACAPGNILRVKPNLNVRVGNHIAPQGGPDIAAMMDGILAETKIVHPYATHHRYETLHPFTDGNGQSGRALWMWQHFNSPSGKPQRVKQLGFLHAWYYESLEFGR